MDHKWLYIEPLKEMLSNYSYKPKIYLLLLLHNSILYKGTVQYSLYSITNIIIIEVCINLTLKEMTVPNNTLYIYTADLNESERLMLGIFTDDTAYLVTDTVQVGVATILQAANTNLEC